MTLMIRLLVTHHWQLVFVLKHTDTHMAGNSNGHVYRQDVCELL
jgi:hypothetical protein